MADKTNISYADHTFNPHIGCSHYHTGCHNCYAEADFDKRRRQVKWGPNGTRRITAPSNWKKPYTWNRKAEETGKRPRVLCGSLCDVFEDWVGPIVNADKRRLWTADREPGRYVAECDEGSLLPIEQENIANGVFRPATMDDLRRDLFRTIDATPYLDWLLTTKRIENVPDMWLNGYGVASVSWAYRENCWLLYSASDQETLDAGLPHLLKCRDLVPVLGLSLEPLVGPVDLGAYLYLCPDCEGESPCSRSDCRDGYINDGLDWVIVGGESGPNARPCHIDWVRAIVRQCQAAGVACYVKQLGAKPISKAVPMQVAVDEWKDYPEVMAADPKGGDPSEWPEDVQVRQLPGRTEP